MHLVQKTVLSNSKVSEAPGRILLSAGVPSWGHCWRTTEGFHRLLLLRSSHCKLGFPKQDCPNWGPCLGFSKLLAVNCLTASVNGASLVRAWETGSPFRPQGCGFTLMTKLLWLYWGEATLVAEVCKELGVDTVLWARAPCITMPLLLGTLCSMGWNAQSPVPPE